MSRNKGRSRDIEKAKREWANLLRYHLDQGQRPSGRGEPWNPTTFATALSMLDADGEAPEPVAESNVRSWLAGTAPNKVEPILQVLFGTNKDYQRLRGELRDAWLAAKGRGPGPEVAGEPGNALLDWDDRSERAYINGVTLRWHRPREANEPDALYVDASLLIEPDDLDPDKGDIVLGIREPLLAIVSKRYRAAKDSMVGQRMHDYFEWASDGAKVVNPKDEFGRVKGDLLRDTHVALLEPHAPGADQVTALLLAGRRCFIVTERDASGKETLMSDENKNAVINALINDQLPKERPLGRLVLARATMRRKPRLEC
jgi:hypothetical protein